MKRQYKVVREKFYLDLEFEEFLNEMVEKGWEFVSSHSEQDPDYDLGAQGPGNPFTVMQFKQKVPEPPAKNREFGSWSECNCVCHFGHFGPEGTALHCVPCCTPCQYCGRNIVGDFGAHVAEKHANLQRH